MDNEIIVKAIISVEKIFFPKRRSHIKSNEFGIALVNIEEPIENCETLGKQIKIKGVGCELNIGAEKYKLSCKLVDSNEKWGDTYEIVYINRLIDLKDKVKQHNFLMSILNENVVNKLFETYDDVIDILEKEDTKSLVKIKGIGTASALKLIQKYKDCKDYSEIYTKLGHLGLSSNLIKRLVDFYKSPDVVIDTVNTNPYDLVRVDSIGFKKADEIADKVGISGSNPNRVKGALLYILSQGGETGRSYLHYSDLLNKLNDMIGYVEQDIINSVAKSLIDKKEVYISSNGEYVGLYKYRELEENIANELIRLLQAEPKIKINKDTIQNIINDTEEEQGFKFTDEQKNSIVLFADSNVVCLTGGAGCVDCDTEFFNGTEWKRIDEYKEDDLVLQYNKDGTAELVKPFEYIKLPSDTMWHFKTKYGLDQCLSDEHRVVYETSKGNLNIKSFNEVKEMHEQSSGGFSGKFYTTFNYNGKGIELSEFEIRLMCAVICDGSFKHTYSKNICRVNIKKQRKKDRLEWILNNLGIYYRKEQYNPKDLEYNTYLFKAPRIEKEFTPYWYNCNNEQLKIICDEILNWDGSQLNNRKKFSTTNKQTADFVQFVFSACGQRANINIRNRIGQQYKDKPQYIRKSLEYEITITNRNKVSIGGFHKDNPNKTKIIKYKTKDNFKYCFEVPSSMLVLRRNGNIFITGNCGKSVTMRGMLNLVKQYACIGCSLSGKASVRITEATGMEAMTIHRLLGYSFEGFMFNETNKLPYDVYFMDEATMTSGELFLSFLKAIPNGAKVVFTGDVQQLTPIGSCQVFGDILNSQVIPSARLTKPHRQALESGIIPLSMKIINQEPICDSTFEGKKILGNLQDMELDVFKDDLKPSKRVVKHFLEQYKLENNLMEVQVAVPMKNRGDMCTYNLNLEIQKEINPINENRSNLIIHLDKDRYYTIQTGDKVINTKNNYKAKTINGDDVAVFNGNMGIVKEIKDGFITIDFDGLGEIVLDSTGSKSLELGYACSVHKLQGSQFNRLIFAINSSDYVLLNAELGYTGITRASKYCVFIFKQQALKTMLNKREVKNKQTYLTMILQNKLLKR